MTKPKNTKTQIYNSLNYLFNKDKATVTVFIMFLIWDNMFLTDYLQSYYKIGLGTIALWALLFVALILVSRRDTSIWVPIIKLFDYTLMIWLMLNTLLFLFDYLSGYLQDHVFLYFCLWVATIALTVSQKTPAYRDRYPL